MVRVQLCFHSTSYSSHLFRTLMIITLVQTSSRSYILSIMRTPCWQCSSGSIVYSISCTDGQLPVSCVAAPATCFAPCYSPLCLMPLQLNNNALSLNPVTGNMLHTLPTTAAVASLILCLIRTWLTVSVSSRWLKLRGHRTCISQSCLGPPCPHFSICSPVHTSKPTRSSRCLAAARNSEWFLSFGPTVRHAIASTPESAATAGYLLLVCRSQTPFRLAQSVFPINTYWTCRLEWIGTCEMPATFASLQWGAQYG